MDFQQVHNRKTTHSLKWDNMKNIFKAEDLVPMWVADMDFKAPGAVNEALKDRAEHGIYGYTVIEDQIKENVRNWVRNKHDWDIDTNWLVFSPGVITSLYTAINMYTEEHDKIV